MVFALAAFLSACSEPFGGGGTKTCEVIAPPAEAGFDSSYESYLFCSGIPLLGTAGVEPEALRVADQTMAFMLEGNGTIFDRALAQGYYFVLRGPDVKISDLPERFTGFLDEHAGVVDPSINAGTSNGHELLCDVRPGVYFDNNVFLHEFVHVMHFAGFDVGSAQDDEINQTHGAAVEDGLWDNTYAARNPVEYFAVLTQIWFEVGAQKGPPEGDGSRGPIVTRDELLAYDPRGHALVGSIFQSGFDVPGCFSRTGAKAYRAPEVSCPASVRDVEGTEYRVVQIGSQCWMAENLRTTRFLDGSEVPAIAGDAAWAAVSGPAVCNYDDLEENVSRLGRLYNYAALRSEAGLCPEGMRPPTKSDFGQLGRAVALEARKDSIADQLRAVDGWEAPALDTQGFAALPSGLRASTGAFEGGGVRWSMWLADEKDAANAWGANLFSNFEYLGDTEMSRSAGLAVRCLSP